ncbi:MAG TPA: LolA family protein, partial [Candidatus Hypogeohydataceae bacterium YC38]
MRYKPILYLIILLVGCATMEHVVIGPPRVLSVEEIQADVSTNAQKISTLKAKVELTVASRDLTGPLICSGYVRMERPKRLRIVCSKLFTTLFDVVSDGHEFWLYIPKEKKV